MSDENDVQPRNPDHDYVFHNGRKIVAESSEDVDWTAPKATVEALWTPVDSEISAQTRHGEERNIDHQDNLSSGWGYYQRVGNSAHSGDLMTEEVRNSMENTHIGSGRDYLEGVPGSSDPSVSRLSASGIVSLEGSDDITYLDTADMATRPHSKSAGTVMKTHPEWETLLQSQSHEPESASSKAQKLYSTAQYQVVNSPGVNPGYAQNSYAGQPGHVVQKVVYPMNHVVGYYPPGRLGASHIVIPSQPYGSYGYWAAVAPSQGTADRNPTQCFKVEFKAGRSESCSAPSMEGYMTGEHVIVEADRGKDLGSIVSQVVGPDETVNGESKPTAGASSMKLSDYKKILRRALPTEIAQMKQKSEDEEKALDLCRQKAADRNLPIEITQAEFQFDRRKLTFFFRAQNRIDFRDLIRDVFKVYKTRIWMKQYGAGSEHFKNKKAKDDKADEKPDEDSRSENDE